ncbi:MAG: hypothetical protein IJA00_04070 [Bacteroidaceae bacterium]|nr:hypothetical protein [Bacteroidaceae bacterium]
MNGYISANTMNTSEINTGVSPAFIEKILGLGLSLMTEEAQKERLERVVVPTDTMTTIDGQALAALIDECRDALRLLAKEGNTAAVSKEQLDAVNSEKLNEVKSLLASIDGKKVVAGMNPDALVELVMDYRENVVKKK